MRVTNVNRRDNGRSLVCRIVLPVLPAMPDPQNFDCVIFHAIHDQIWRLAYRPLAGSLNMSLPSDLGIVTQSFCGIPHTLCNGFSSGWIISCDIILGFNQIR